MSSIACGKYLFLLGGVGLQTSPDIIVVNLMLQTWFGLTVSYVTSVCTEVYILHALALAMYIYMR